MAAVSLLATASIYLARKAEAKAAWRRFEVTRQETDRSTLQWNQEEAAYWLRIDQSLGTPQEKAAAVDLLTRILEIERQRTTLMTRFFADLRTAFRYSKEMARLDRIHEWEERSRECTDRYRDGVEMYIDYLSTDDGSTKELAQRLLGEARSLSEAIASLAAEVLK